jgi:hypothetical protein
MADDDRSSEDASITASSLAASSSGGVDPLDDFLSRYTFSYSPEYTLKLRKRYLMLDVPVLISRSELSCQTAEPISLLCAAWGRSACGQTTTLDVGEADGPLW